MRATLSAALGLWLVASSGAAVAQSLDSERDRLKALEQQVTAAKERQQTLTQDAQRLAQEAEQATKAMIQLAAKIQSREDRLAGVELELRVLNDQLKRRVDVLNVRRASVVRLLGALQARSRRPAALVLVQPSSAVDTARTASLLLAVIPELERQTEGLRREIASLNVVRAQVNGRVETQRRELAGLVTDQKQLDQARLSREAMRQAALDQASEETTRIARLAQEAEDVQDLLSKLATENRVRDRLARLPGPRLRPETATAPQVATVAPTPERGTVELPGRSIRQSQGNLPLPVRGELAVSYGEDTPSGPSKGISISTRPDAQVIAPYGGRIMFAGAFRAYGLLLIIEHGDGYHSLLSGLGKIDGKVGDSVQSGEPVGLVGPAEGGGSTLYFELRRNGAPINPLPWLVAGLRKSQG
jgi:murein hydrolase activator